MYYSGVAVIVLSYSRRVNRQLKPEHWRFASPPLKSARRPGGVARTSKIENEMFSIHDTEPILIIAFDQHKVQKASCDPLSQRLSAWVICHKLG